MKAALYARVSGPGQVEEASIETQIEEILELARRMGVTIGEDRFYLDEAVSGRLVAFSDRPAGSRLMDAIRAGEVDTLLAWKQSRIGRDAIDTLLTIKRLRQAHIKTHYVHQHFEDSSEGRLLQELIAVFDSYTAATISQETLSGKKRCAEQGWAVNGGIPYGYRSTQQEPHWRYAIWDTPFGEMDLERPPHAQVLDLTPAAVAHKIFVMVAIEHMSAPRICEWLRTMRVPTSSTLRGRKNASSKWYPSTIQIIIRNTFYRGVDYWGSDMIEREVPRLVSDDLWHAAQKAIHTNGHNNRAGENRVYILAGLITCPYCGSRYVGIPCLVRGVERTYYTCSQRANPGRHKVDRDARCRATSIPCRHIDDAVWARVRRWLENPTEMMQLWANEWQRRQGTGDVGPKIVAVKEGLADVERQRQGLNDAWREGAYASAKEFATEKRIVQAQEAALLAQLRRLEAEQVTHAHLGRALSAVESILASIRQGLGESDPPPAVKRAIIRAMVREVRAYAADDPKVQYAADAEALVAAANPEWQRQVRVGDEKSTRHDFAGLPHGDGYRDGVADVALLEIDGCRKGRGKPAPMRASVIYAMPDPRKLPHELPFAVLAKIQQSPSHRLPSFEGG